MNSILYMIPASPQVTAQRDAAGNITALCLDVESERILQHQRKFAYTVGGPAVAVAGLLLMKDKPLYGLFITALGGACTYWHATSYRKVEEALQSATPASPTPTL
jgi:uncharacterized membrane protein